ncbi:MAG: hypothetical protein WC742_12105 [Gallionellaceae bacterium]|jgi:hypothetical protein
MDMKKLIERAEIAAGSQKELALKIGQSESNIRAAKGGARGLPTYACVLIADLIGEDEIVVIAASELATEKHANRRAIWEKKLEAIAACLILAFVTTVVTPSPANASTATQVTDSISIMSNCKNKLSREISSVAANIFKKKASPLHCLSLYFITFKSCCDLHK